MPAVGETPAVTFNINNTLWPSSKFLGGMKPELLDILVKDYGSGLHALDYHIDADTCRVEINGAVYDWSNNRIEELIPLGELNSYTAFVITSTLYMNAPWATVFNEWGTQKGDFTNYDGSMSSVDIMRYGLESSMRYAVDGQVQALAIPYRGDKLEMIAFLPDSGKFDSFELYLG